MRKLVALAAAVLLTASLASASVAAAPTSRVNRFVGNFDLVDWDMHTPVAHVVANVGEVTEQNLVGGTVDIYWAAGSPFWAWDSSPYFTDGRVPRQSHVQVFKVQFAQGDFDTYSTTDVWVSGYLCSYWGPPPADWGHFDAACQRVVIDFQQINDAFTPHRVGFSLPDDAYWGCCEGPWYPATRDGSFVTTFVGPTYP